MENIEIDRIIEMCWEDRTPFEAIEYQFGLKEEDAIKIMRRTLNRNHLKFGEREFQKEYKTYGSTKFF